MNVNKTMKPVREMKEGEVNWPSPELNDIIKTRKTKIERENASAKFFKRTIFITQINLVK